jgi:hypothetical protein
MENKYVPKMQKLQSKTVIGSVDVYKASPLPTPQ